MSAVRTDDLTVTYGSVLALDSVTIEIPCGSSVAIIGPNGCGKSTLLKTLAGIITPASGTVQVDGRPAMVLQSTDVDRSVPITVRDAVAMGRYPTLGPLRRFRPADWATVHEAMTRLAIDDLANRPIHYLSGGQRQRVLVAQGLTQESSVLLLDEPLTGLDVASRSIILDVLDEEKLGGRTTVTSTHNFQDAQRSDLVLLLATHLVAFGPADEVLMEDQLHKAFGGHFMRIGSTLLLSDPHHDESH
ncbi:MAG: metal ABC transporter ATP-binding protein [Ilumatobacteraceae bacterium]|nr:metal ABC transporter ATP-binding protein [Ilumatobacteraceae bacterium]